MSNVARRRIIRDLRRLEEEGPPGMSAAPFPTNMMILHCVLQGPVDTDWEAGIFHLIASIPSDYPLKPPNVRFLSKIFHPNIYPDGRICLDLLNKAWSPNYDISSVLASIQSLLSDPNIDSPACVEAAELLKKDIITYRNRVLLCVEDSWNVPDLPCDIAKEVEE